MHSCKNVRCQHLIIELNNNIQKLDRENKLLRQEIHSKSIQLKQFKKKLKLQKKYIKEFYKIN